MAVHHGGKISRAARTLAKKASTKKQKTKAAKYSQFIIFAIVFSNSLLFHLTETIF